MNKYRKYAALIAVGLAFLPYLASPVYAQIGDNSGSKKAIIEREAEGGRNPSDGNPGILPTNPFYFLKEWRRSFIKIFISNSQKRIEAELGDLNDRLAEIKKLESLDAKAESVKDALVRYEINLSSFNDRLNGTRQGEISYSLLNKIIDSALAHNNFLEDLKIKFADDPFDKTRGHSEQSRTDEPELGPLISNIENQLGGIIAAVQKYFKPPDDFKANLERAVFGNADAKEVPIGIIKELRAAEILNRAEKKSGGDHLIKINEIKNGLMKNIAGEMEKAGDNDLAEILSTDFLKKIPAGQIQNFEGIKGYFTSRSNKGMILTQ